MIHPTSAESLLKFMRININHDSSFTTNLLYSVKTVKELLQQRKGICYDQVEYERYVFERLDCIIHTYLLYDKLPLNSNLDYVILVFEKDNNLYWFEYDWEELRGVYGPFKSEYCLFQFIYHQCMRIKKWEIVNIVEFKKPLIDVKKLKLDKYLNFIYSNCLIGDIWTHREIE